MRKTLERIRKGRTHFRRPRSCLVPNTTASCSTVLLRAAAWPYISRGTEALQQGYVMSSSGTVYSRGIIMIAVGLCGHYTRIRVRNPHNSIGNYFGPGSMQGLLRLCRPSKRSEPCRKRGCLSELNRATKVAENHTMQVLVSISQAHSSAHSFRVRRTEQVSQVCDKVPAYHKIQDLGLLHFYDTRRRFSKKVPLGLPLSSSLDNTTS